MTENNNSEGYVEVAGAKVHLPSHGEGAAICPYTASKAISDSCHISMRSLSLRAYMPQLIPVTAHPSALNGSKPSPTSRASTYGCFKNLSCIRCI